MAKVISVYKGDNLRLIVRDAPAGAEISIEEADEFEGPFVFDRPLRLTGQGDHPRAITLWTRRGPAIIVRSAGVSLAKLNVELTLPEARQSDAIVWYAAGCQPDIQNAQIQGQIELMGKGQSSGGWKLPDLIDLGDLWAKHSVTLPMLIEVPGPATLRGELANLQIEPARLPAGGEHLIRVGIPDGKLFKDTVLAGQLVVESQGETRSVWIIGRVLEDEFKKWAKDKIILVGKSGRKFAFGLGMLLGKEQLHGEPGADRVAEKQAYIMKESSGVWSIIQPLPVSQPTEVNGRPLDVGRRVLLKGGEVIRIGSLELTVEATKTDLPITLDGTVDFGKLSARAKSAPAIEVKNTKRRKWEGTLRSTVPWIQVPQPQVVCPANQTVQVPVQLGTGLSSLPRQLINYTGALILEGSAESWVISAQLHVDVEEGLEVEPTILDFGQVSIPAAVAPQRLRVRNVGSADWQGTAQVEVPWLVVDQTSLRCAAGAETTLEVRLTDDVTALPEGPNRAADVLRIEGQGLSVTVGARLHFDKPKVQLDIQPRTLDWGRVMDWRAAPSQVITLRNTGAKDWRGSAASHVPWLEVTPAALQCPAQGQVDLTVRLTDQFQGLATGEHKVPAALRIEGEGLSFSILARLEIEISEIDLDATSVYLVLDDRSALPHHTLRLQNRGRQNWHGTAKSTLRWLEISPSDIACPAGGEAVIDVTLSPEVTAIFKKPRMVRVDDGIRIEGRGQPIQVGVQLEIKSLIAPLKQEAVSPPPPVPSPPPTALTADFGTVTDWSGPMPTREIRLTNSQAQAMSGTARSTLPWLEVTPTNFSCLPGQDAVLTAKLTKKAAFLRPKEYDVDDGVVIEYGNKKQLVHARLEVVWAPPPPPPTALTVDFGTVSDWSGPMPTREIRLTNSQAQVMSGKARSTLPWLEVTPTNFACPPGQDAVLTAKLTKKAAFLRPKEYDVDDGVVIEYGDKRQLVHTRLEVVWAPPPPPPPQPRMVDFGTVSDWSRPLPTREIRLTNSQAQEMNGTAHSTLPWLEVTPTSFSCPPGRDVVLTARLTDKAAFLRPNKYDVDDGVVIEHGNEKQLVRTRLEVIWAPSPPPPPPPLLPRMVDFGTVTDWSGPLPTQEVRLTNSETQVMDGVVRSTVPWLEVTPTSFSCAPGQEVMLTAQLTEFAKRLRSKEYDVANGVIIECGGKKHPVHVRLVVATSYHPLGMRTILPPREVEAAEQAKPEKTPKPKSAKAVAPAKKARKLREALGVEPASIDMGSVSDWSGSLPSREIELSNGLKTDWSGTVQSTVPWLKVAPTETTCPAGASVTLQVRLTKRGARLRPRTYLAADALIIEGDGQTLKVAAQMTVE